MKILKPTSEMDREDIFSALPSEIILNILSRIPIRTVFTCKCVCKSWLEILKTPEFIRYHLSKSVPRVLVHTSGSVNMFQIFEFEDSSKIDRLDLHYRALLRFDLQEIFNLSRYGSCAGSANGLIFLQNPSWACNFHYICNPITREYIKLPKPKGICRGDTVVSYGFGVSRLSNQYKAVRIFHGRVHDPVTGSLVSIPNSVWQVYTLGTGSWRGIATPSEMLLDYSRCSFCTLWNGNLHWLARDTKGSWWISCFDLETEVKFRAPSGESLMDIGIFRNCLCLCDNSSTSEISIFLMDDYGEKKKSWNKEYVISKPPPRVYGRRGYNVVEVVKALGDGDLLIESPKLPFIFYSNRTKTTTIVSKFSANAVDFF